MKKTILLILIPQHLSNFSYKRLGVGINYNNYQILYWNLLPMMNKAFNRKLLRKIKKKNFINIISLSSLRKQIKLLPTKFFYFNACGNEYFISIICRFLSIVGGKKIYIDSGGCPNISKEVRKNYFNYIKIYYKKNKYFLYNKLKRKIFDSIKNFICEKLLLPKNKIYFATNEKSFLSYSKIVNSKKIFKINCDEMNNFIKFNNVNRNKKRIVFIDQELEDPFDQKIVFRDTSIIYDKNYYWSQLNILFDKISKSLKHKIDIAAHPRREKKNYLFKRDFTYNKTLKLIAESQLVVTMHSMAAHYAILLRKPLLFIYSSIQTRPGDIENGLMMAKETGSTFFDYTNIDKKKKINFNFKKILKVNKKKYKEYEKNYICFKDRSSNGRWKKVLKNLTTIY